MVILQAALIGTMIVSGAYVGLMVGHLVAYYATKFFLSRSASQPV